MPRTFLTLLAAALGAALLLAHPVAWADGGTVQVSVEVPEGKTRSARLRNMPRGAKVAVKVSAAGPLQIVLISAAQLKSKRPEALFRGTLERSLSFGVLLPEAGDYYLVLDNRRGAKPVKARATIRAQKNSPAPSAPGVDKPAGRLNET